MEEERWYNLKPLTFQENEGITYYIVVKESILKWLNGQCNANIGKVYPGMLVQAIGVEDNNSLRVRLDHKTKDPIWNKTEWECHPVDLLQISHRIWHLLSAIDNYQERVKLANDKQFCKGIESIKLNSTVLFCPDDNRHEKYLANVKSIGPVEEIGYGYYFTLELIDKTGAYPFNPLTKKYFESSNLSELTIATISQINILNTKGLEEIKNFEKNFLSNDMLQPKKTDNFFVTKNRDIVDSKRNIDIVQKNKYSLLVDTDNNNQASRLKESVAPTIENYPVQSYCHEQQNDNKKLDKHLKSFDPLNSDDKIDEISKSIQQPTNSSDLIVGSCVKVLVDSDVHYGVVRWIGTREHPYSDKLMAAIELEDPHPLATDGTYQDVRYFQCGPKKAFFTDIKDCQQYDMAASSCYYKPEIQNIEPVQSSVVKGAVPPISVKGDIKRICGKYRGIQGHHNSCYLDATLFSMFAFTSVFDSLLFRPPNEKDCPQYEEVQRVLCEEIVNPLRKNWYVCAKRVMKLRTLLEKLSSVSGLTSEEKDPEEFLTSLVAQTLNAEPFLKLSSGQDAYHYQLFVEKDEHLTLPTVQHLLEQSFLTSNIRLKEVPSCLILQMPRFGKSYKMYSRIQPTLLLDVTDIIEDSPRQCNVCGELAKFECKECYGERGEGLESIAFCKECLRKVHTHENRTNHEPRHLTVPDGYEILKEHCSIPRLYLELLAVVCIETSHYVSFVKCAPGSDAPWCFFDSMADRQGEENGFNVPQMVECSNFPFWLSEEGAKRLATMRNDRELPEDAKRLLCDAYMCMYQSPDVMMYK